MAVLDARAELFRFSASRLEAFRCPHRWMVHYVLGQPEPDTEATIVGTCVHNTVEAVVNYTKEQGLKEFPKPRSKVVAAFVDEFVKVAQTDAAEKGVALSNSDVQEMGRMARKAVEVLQGLDPDCVHTEYHAVVPLPDGTGEFQVYMDLVVILGDHGRIIDLKTGRVAYDVLADPKVQLPLYGWVAEQVFPEVKSWSLELHFLRVGTVATHQFDDTVRQKAVEYLGERTAAIRTAVERNEFLPAPGHHCGFCPIAGNCPAARAEVLEGAETPETLFGLYLATEARLQSLKERLQKIVQEQGPIECRGEYLGFYSTVSQVWTKLPETAQALRALGLVPDDYVVWDQQKLRRLAEKYPQLLKVAERKLNIRFDHKPTPPEALF